MADPVTGQYYGAPSPPISSVGMSYGDTGWDLHNPAMMDPSQLNPYATKYTDSINSLLGQFQSSAAGGAFNPNFYQHMQDTSQANLVTGVENSYARAGLGGSSAAMGGVSSAIEHNQMDWLNRQQSDQMRALGGIEGLDAAGMKDLMGIQGQYGQFQDTYNQDILSLLGVNQQQNSANNSLWGSIAQGVGSMGIAAAALL